VLRYLVSRVLQAAMVVIGVATVVFILEHLLPGDQGKIMLGPRAVPAQWAVYDHQNGLDQPIPVQYVAFLGNLLHGRIAFTPPGFADQIDPIQGVAVDLDLRSLVEGPMINSLILTGLSTLVVISVTVPIALYEAARRRRRGACLEHHLNDAVLNSSIPLGHPAHPRVCDRSELAEPQRARLEPRRRPCGPRGADPPGADSVDGHRRTVQPLSPGVDDGRAGEGLHHHRARQGSIAHPDRHAPRPTQRVPSDHHLAGTRLPQIFGAQLIVEVLFSYPGLGSTLWSAALNRDFYTMLGAILIGGVLTVLGSLVTDLVYAAVDPRIRYVRPRS
jgi:peptide/nickel transport system permease protein